MKGSVNMKAAGAGICRARGRGREGIQHTKKPHGEKPHENCFIYILLFLAKREKGTMLNLK